MSDRVTLGVQFDQDSDLLEEFEEYKEEHEFASSAETLRHLMRKELEGDEPSGPERDELRRELRELRDRQRTPLEEGGYLFGSVVAGTSPIAMLYLSGIFATPLAFVGGLAVALVGLLIGAVTKIVADNTIRADGGSAAVSGVSE
jgi:hypothetical protein